MIFKNLKQKYSEYDIIKDDESTIMINDILFKENGDIFLSRAGFSLDNHFLSISTKLAEKRTPEMMDMFIQSIL